MDGTKVQTFSSLRFGVLTVAPGMTWRAVCDESSHPAPPAPPATGVLPWLCLQVLLDPQRKRQWEAEYATHTAQARRAAFGPAPARHMAPGASAAPPPQGPPAGRPRPHSVQSPNAPRGFAMPPQHHGTSPYTAEARYKGLWRRGAVRGRAVRKNPNFFL